MRHARGQVRRASGGTSRARPVRCGTVSDAPAEPTPGTGAVWCIVVAAGSGRRYGGAKQFDALAGERVLDRSVAVARRACDGVVVVLAPDVIGTPDAGVPGADRVVAGGDTRAASVRAGLVVVPDDAGVVLVHDAARPLASDALFDRVIAAVRAGATAVVPAVAVTDTVRHLDDGVVDRDQLRAVQTPQGFRPSSLRDAHADATDATDDAALVERAGGTVVLVDGEESNIKITGPQDRAVAEAILAGRTREGGDSAR
jgi:2-C-methyl-D-erythritol 4-phosphate cytidylyltransferase